MDDMTLPQLKAACQEAGLSIYGNKAELIARLQANAASQLADTVSPEIAMVAEDGVGLNPEDADAATTMVTMQASANVKMVEPVRIIQPSLAELKHLATRPNVAVEQVKKLVEDINSKYAGAMQARYNPDHETIEFHGGLQGIWCTTVHQPIENIMNRDGIKGAADQYAKVSREALFHARTPQNAIGSLGGIN